MSREPPYDDRRGRAPAPDPVRPPNADLQRAGAFKAVTSLANPTIKEIRALQLRKHRAETGLFLGEGVKLAADAMAAGWPVRTLVVASDAIAHPFVARTAATARARGALVIEANEAVMAKISRRDNPQTVIGVFEQHIGGLEAIAAAKPGIWIALEAVRDPGNLGTIVRTADALGAAGVLLVGETTDPFGLEAVRATMGSFFHVPLARASVAEFLAWRKSYRGLVVGTHLAGAVDIRSVDYREPAVLAMGNEQAGLSPEMAAACDHLVKIPMAGQADSLNLAISTGIALFEMRRGKLAL